MEKQSKPLKVRCAACDHSWAVAYMPLEVSVIVKIVKNAHCPACGASPRRIVICAPE
jgi:hypothetical protein